MSEREALLAECAEVCTSGCHADDCEHHGHLPAERQTGLREAIVSALDWLNHGDTAAAAYDLRTALHRLGPPAATLELAALTAQVPAQEERLREALEQIANLGPLGPFRIVGDELAVAQDIARRALGDESKEEGAG